MSTLERIKQHAGLLRGKDISALASERKAPTRLSACGWNIDLSRHFMSDGAELALIEFAKEHELSQRISSLFSADIINPSENRPALHWALRAPDAPAGEPESVRESLLAALKAANDIKTGDLKASGGQKFSAIVHIGIGGSDFGPRLVADAFADSRRADLDLRFCANLDPLDLDLALSELNPATTLIVGISKSFGTEETLYNLSRARDWLKASIGEAWAQHILLVTANPTRADAWIGKGCGHRLHMPESVGGRFSIWSAGSFAVMAAMAGSVFEDFLAGADEMDKHVASAPLKDNLAVRLALLDYWNTSVLGSGARAVLAYSRRLRMLPTYLQQLEMESNGKATGPDGSAVDGFTAPLLWGGEGTIGQHSYHQWLHQGTFALPTEFIIAPGGLSDENGVISLKAHALAQAEVLANGRSLDEVRAEEPDLPDAIARQKVHPGGRPSTVMSIKQLTPHALGALIALYEHRTYLAGVLWGLNSFDQWGVERGKTMASRIKSVLQGDAAADDDITARLAKQVSS